MNTAALIAKLVLCATALRSGQGYRCLPLLLDLIAQLRESDVEETHPLEAHNYRDGCEEEDDDTYIWDQPYSGEPPQCRQFE